MGVRRAVRALLPLFYFLAVSLPHHPFSYWLDDVFITPVGYYSVQHIADVASWILLAAVAAVCVRIAIVHRWRSLRHFSLLVILVLFMYTADYYLIVNNIERIHYPQYAALALLLGLSLRGEMLIFFVTVFAGFLDEFLQFAMDPMKTNYLDFNDIVLNILGAAAGVVLLIGLRKPPLETVEKENNRPRTKASPIENIGASRGKKDRQESAKNVRGFGLSLFNSAWRPRRSWRFSFSDERSVPTKYEAILGVAFRLSMLVGATVVLVAGLLGRIVMLVEQKKDRAVFEVINGKLSFIMSFERHDEFWIKSYFGKVFHVMSVGEGIAVIAILAIGTWGLVRWLRVRHGEPNE